jgi:hypothetical protein
LGTSYCPHGVVVFVKTEAVEAEENTDPVEVRYDGITVTENSI